MLSKTPESARLDEQQIVDQQAMGTNDDGMQGTEDVDDPEAEADLTKRESAGVHKLETDPELEELDDVHGDVWKAENGNARGTATLQASGGLAETDRNDAKTGSNGEKTSLDSVGTSEYGTARESAGGSDLGSESEQADESE